MRSGLVFVAFGHSFDAFEAQLRRVVSEDEGIVDALFNRTRPQTGTYFWRLPLAGGKLDLSTLGCRDGKTTVTGGVLAGTQH